MRYIHHLHTTLADIRADIRIGEKVAIAHWPDPTASIRVSNGVVVAVSATAVRVAWEGNDRSPLDMFTEGTTGLSCLRAAGAVHHCGHGYDEASDIPDARRAATTLQRPHLPSVRW